MQKLLHKRILSAFLSASVILSTSLITFNISAENSEYDIDIMYSTDGSSTGTALERFTSYIAPHFPAYDGECNFELGDNPIPQVLGLQIRIGNGTPVDVTEIDRVYTANFEKNYNQMFEKVIPQYRYINCVDTTKPLGIYTEWKETNRGKYSVAINTDRYNNATKKTLYNNSVIIENTTDQNSKQFVDSYNYAIFKKSDYDKLFEEHGHNIKITQDMINKNSTDYVKNVKSESYTFNLSNYEDGYYVICSSYNIFPQNGNLVMELRTNSSEFRIKNSMASDTDPFSIYCPITCNFTENGIAKTTSAKAIINDDVLYQNIIQAGAVRKQRTPVKIEAADPAFNAKQCKNLIEAKIGSNGEIYTFSDPIIDEDGNWWFEINSSNNGILPDYPDTGYSFESLYVRVDNGEWIESTKKCLLISGTSESQIVPNIIKTSENTVDLSVSVPNELNEIISSFYFEVYPITVYPPEMDSEPTVNEQVFHLSSRENSISYDVKDLKNGNYIVKCYPVYIMGKDENGRPYSYAVDPDFNYNVKGYSAYDFWGTDGVNGFVISVKNGKLIAFDYNKPFEKEDDNKEDDNTNNYEKPSNSSSSSKTDTSSAKNLKDKISETQTTNDKNEINLGTASNSEFSNIKITIDTTNKNTLDDILNLSDTGLAKELEKIKKAVGTLNTNNFSTDFLNAVNKLNDKDIYKFNFSEDSVFKFPVNIIIDIGQTLENGTYHLYYYNPKTKKFEYCSDCQISSGKAKISLNHCSDYILSKEKINNSIAAGEGIIEKENTI